MDTKTEQKEIVELLARNEETISKVYKIFADKFPNDKQFWQILSQEELIHASWIRKLHVGIEDGKPAFNEGRFATGPIKESVDYMNGQIHEFKTQNLSSRRALSTAMEIENTPIESKFYEVYTTDSEILKQLLSSLEQAFLDHRDRIEEKIKSI